MKNLGQLFTFLMRGPFYDFRVFYSYIASFLFGSAKSDFKIYSEVALSDKLKNGQSLIRFGDGEVMIMLGRDIHYQQSSRLLSKDLRMIINTPNKKSPILAIPVEAVLLTDEELRRKKRFRIWRLFRCFAKIRFDFSKYYADAHCFYRQSYLQSLLPQLLPNKHVICVTKKETLDTILESYLKRFSPAVTLIEGPNENAYESSSLIESKIWGKIKESNLVPLIIFSIGPASKVLAHRFAMEGIQSLDIGHGLEIVGRDMDYSEKI